ncbi:hypothetical protein AAHA92_09378 [Salvia divinorum]|uniref:Uncharacterized protein n=1 Tax=Salvia divinorum TaxID=28513 RepID=A0ABD1HRA7_SALDI
MPPKRKRAKKGQPPPRQEVIDVDDETWDIRPSEFDPYACAYILKNGHPLTEYVSYYYSLETIVSLYKHVLYPINGMHDWPKTSEVGFELQPPRTKPHRPRKKRREGGHFQTSSQRIADINKPSTSNRIIAKKEETSCSKFRSETSSEKHSPTMRSL